MRKISFDVEKGTALVGDRRYTLAAIEDEGEIIGYSITVPGGDMIDSWWHLDGNFAGTFETIDDALAIRDAMRKMS